MRDKFAQLGIRHYIPTHQVTRICGHKRCKVDAPLISNLIFINCDKATALSLANGYGLPMKYLIDHATRTLLEVPAKQMDDFIRVVEEDPSALCPPDQVFQPGQKVRVIAGNLQGVEGEVIEQKEGTYLQISLCGLLNAKILIQTAYVQAIPGRREP